MKTSIATIGVLAAANCDLFEMLQGVAASHNSPPGLYTPSPGGDCFTQPFTQLTETPMGTFTGYVCSTPNCTEYVVPGTTGRLRRKSSFAFLLPNARKENSYECNTCQQRKSLRGSELQRRVRKDSQMLAMQLGVEWDSSQGHLTDAEVKQLFSQVGGGSDAQAEKAGWNGEVRSGTTSLKKEYAASSKGGNFGGSLADDRVGSTGEGMSAEEEKSDWGSTGSNSIFGANKGGNFGGALLGGSTRPGTGRIC